MAYTDTRLSVTHNVFLCSQL